MPLSQQTTVGMGQAYTRACAAAVDAKVIND
jgi:hypothetical protein